MSKSQNPTVFGNGLRDRIAAAVAVVGFSDSWATPPQPSEFDYEVADAVIRELSEPQRGELVPCPTCDDRQCMDCVLRHQHDRCANTCPRCGDGR